jgi:hypothetical protein
MKNNVENLLAWNQNGPFAVACTISPVTFLLKISDSFRAANH